LYCNGTKAFFNVGACKVNELDRITLNLEICHGKPCIRGMLWPVEVILDMLVAGMSTAEIISDHQELETADIIAALKYARLLVSGQTIRQAA
jgi:uncharacterized protein (DUF433 family)